MNPETECTAEEALDTVSDGFLVVERDWKLVRGTEGAEKLFDRETGSVAGEVLWDALPGVGDTEVEERLRSAMDSSTITEFQCFNGEVERWIRIFCCPADQGLTIYLKDVTEQVEAQQEVERMNDKLLLINRIMRHDIRNDMAVVQGWSEELESHVDDEGEEILERIVHSTRHAIRLTDSARDSVEMVTGDESTELEQEPLREVLGEEIERCRGMFGEAVIEAEDVPEVQVKGNALLSSVFNNVIGNAVEHNDEEEPRVEISVDVDDDVARVEVADNGPGVAEANRDAVFGRGPQGLDHPAAGLGLHLVDRVLKECGGYVWIEDNEPEGAVFKIELMLAETEGGEADV